MSQYTDQLGNSILLSSLPKRIISLVPSQTELLFDLGLDEAVIGITKFCIHPEQWFRSKTRIGGTKNLNIEAIRTLQPDLIIANKEENVKEQVEALQQIAPVWVSDINTLEDALSMIQSISDITGTIANAKQIIQNIEESFDQLSSNGPPVSAAYLIWKDPYMTIGGDSFISDMLQRAGFENAFVQLSRYPEVTIDQLKQSHCEIIFLSSEPYPFRQEHADEIQSFLPGKKIILADGEMFSWYGSRLQHAAGYFRQLRHEIIQ